MGFMDKLFKILGFEGEDVKVTKKKKAPQASYNLKITQKLPDEIDGVKVYYPENLANCRDKVEYIKKETPFILDFRNCSHSEKNKILDYYHGVIDVLGAKEEILDKNMYLFLPKDFEIETR